MHAKMAALLSDLPLGGRENRQLSTKITLLTLVHQKGWRDCWAMSYVSLRMTRVPARSETVAERRDMAGVG